LDIAKAIQPEIANQVKNADWGSRDIQVLETVCPKSVNSPPAP
jgi:hypothetical protein